MANIKTMPQNYKCVFKSTLKLNFPTNNDQNIETIYNHPQNLKDNAITLFLNFY